MRSPTTYRMQNRSDAPGGTRTPDQQLRRLPLYPSELLAPALPLAPPAGPARGSTPNPLLLERLLEEIGAAGFEPATSCSQSRRDTGLRYAPQISGRLCYPADAPRSTGIGKSVANSSTRQRASISRTGSASPHMSLTPQHLSDRVGSEQCREGTAPVTHRRLCVTINLSECRTEVVG